MEIKKGIGVSPGVVIGTAVVLDADDLVVPRRQVPAAESPAEASRLGEAIAHSTVVLSELRTKLAASHGSEIADIFGFHLAVLRDKTLLKQIMDEITKNHASAEFAVSSVMRKYAQTFAQLPDRYLAERAKDIHDLERRLIHELIGQKREDLSHLTRDIVVIAHDMMPSQTAAGEPVTRPSSRGRWGSRRWWVWAM
jgi:phosphotransferase system enzyme I (PtsI)